MRTESCAEGRSAAAYPRDAQPALENADQRGLGTPQQAFCGAKWSLYIRRHCLPKQCVLSVRVQSLLQETASIVVRPAHCFHLVAGVK